MPTLLGNIDFVIQFNDYINMVNNWHDIVVASFMHILSYTPMNSFYCITEVCDKVALGPHE